MSEYNIFSQPLNEEPKKERHRLALGKRHSKPPEIAAPSGNSRPMSVLPKENWIESASPKAIGSEAAQPEEVQPEPMRPEKARPEPVQQEEVRSEPMQPEEVRSEPARPKRRKPVRLKENRPKPARFQIGRPLALCLVALAVLTAVLGASLERTWAELAQLRQSMEPPPVRVEEENPTVPAVDGDGTGPDRPAYQDLYPELYAQPHDWNSVEEEMTVYLTFDDGPSARTPEILQILEQYGVKATFFAVGQDTEQGRQWMRDIVAAGHTLAVHSYTHDYYEIYDSVEAYLDDFAKEYHLIEDATGVPPQIFRFPGGSINAYNGQIYQEIASEMIRRGFVYYDWNRANGDAVRNPPSAATLARNALDKLGSSSRVVILMHDSKSHYNTVAALPAIIEGYQNAGYTLKALTPEVRPIIYAYPNP